MMRRVITTLALLACMLQSWGTHIRVLIPDSLLGRPYIIASRIEHTSQPMSLGKIRLCAGLRVYQPQLVRLDYAEGMLSVTADDHKRGPERIALAAKMVAGQKVEADLAPLFTKMLRGVDILSGKQQPGQLDSTQTRITLVKGDATHLEVSIAYTYNTHAEPYRITVRKSLMLLRSTPMEGRVASPLIGYKSSNGKHIDRFDLTVNNPITFYFSDEFPTLWQQAIRLGVADWNKAFARIGHPQAVRAMSYSEAGAGFDPYNLLNNCIFQVESNFENAQGNHWVDPRSGEILQADVLLYRGVAERLKTWLLLQTGASNADIADGQVPDSVMVRLLRYAIAHEIGHCLGLEHNFRASYAYATDSLRSDHFCATHGTTASIMDYARFNYVAQPTDHVRHIYPPLLGPYDIYAIEAGYGSFTNQAAYTDFLRQHQTNPQFLYSKLRASTLLTDEAVQHTDLGDNHLASTQYALRNMAALPVAVLRRLEPTDVYKFYFQLLSHLIPCLDQPAEKMFMEEQLTRGYKVLLQTPRMAQVYGLHNEEIEQMRADFITKAQQQYALDIPADPASTGMWMPHQAAGKDVFALLRQDGIKLSPKDIYAINRHCLSGAALSLSGPNGVGSPSASASLVSAHGLVLTNFHCVSTYVQRMAKPNADYMRYGCWATKREEEAPLAGMEAHQLLSIEDVTAQVLMGTDTLSAARRDAVAQQCARRLMSSSQEPYGVTRRVYSMMGGQQYILARYRTFSDVRIVACPPMWLGAYGGDADNWRWPRYSADFAFLRIYTSPSGDPSLYDPQNVPYKPQSYLRMARKEIAEGDLAIVMGYPSQTRKNIPAYALDRIVNHDTQLRANALKAKIDYLSALRDSATGTARSAYEVRINKLMNVYLRSRGEMDGVRLTRLVERKRQEDLQLQEWIDSLPERQQRYGTHLVHQMDSVYARLTVYNHMDEAFSQFVGSGAGIIPFAGKFEKLLTMDHLHRKSRARDMAQEAEAIRRNIREFFPSISMTEDCGMMKTLLPIYTRAVPRQYLPKALQSAIDIDHLYATSLLTDSTRLEHFLDSCIARGTAELATDTLYRLCLDIYIGRVQNQNREAAPLRRLNTLVYGKYMRAKSEMMGHQMVPFDANHTLRLSAGRVMAIDSVSQMAARSDWMAPKMRQLLANGTPLPIACFTTNAETAAGNSGSAVVNAHGEMIGINFDRTVRSTSSIYRNDPLSMRNIVVSTNYILWVIRHLSHSQYILPELGVK